LSFLRLSLWERPPDDDSNKTIGECSPDIESGVPKKPQTHVRRERANPNQVALIKRREETKWQDMRLQKVVDFAARHQFRTIVGVGR
jgi:hypothetical protein